MYLTNNFEENKKTFDEMLGVGKSYDVQTREFTILNTKVQMYYLDGLVNNLEIIGVMEKILDLPRERNYHDPIEVIYNNITHKAAKIFDKFTDIYDQVLNGVLVFIVEGCNKAIGVETRGYPIRSIGEPDLEKVVRGSHDGFTETLNINIGLLRRRIRDGKLRNEIFNIGTKSKYNVCLSYIEGSCSEDLINYAREKLNSVNIDHLIMTDKALEEVLSKHPFNPYPLVRYTERPDVVSIHLYQGKVAIFVDTSPSVIIAPATYFDHLQHAEEYRQTPMSGTYIRLLRFLGVFLSIFLTPTWLLLVMHNVDLPGFFKSFRPDDTVTLSIFMQILAAEIGIEFLRMASIHTPSSLSTAMGLVAGILLGDIAIQVGIFSVQTVFLVAISAIGSYVTPSYELSLANKLSKLLFLVVIYFFKLPGFIIVVLLWLIFLLRLKSFNLGYLYPLIPFNWKEFKRLVIRTPTKEVNHSAKTKM
ncbi:MAG TPA: spore germination protein [Acholeplasmataceae bacterium]|jgi:stage V sporulation protein AF|nr:spore germination protein [Acholeplasmataceae bacterium]